MVSTLRDESPSRSRAHLRHGVRASREEMRDTLSAIAANAPAALKAVGALLSSGGEASSMVKGAARFAKRHPLVCAAAGAALIYVIAARGSAAGGRAPPARRA